MQAPNRWRDRRFVSTGLAQPKSRRCLRADFTVRGCKPKTRATNDDEQVPVAEHRRPFSHKQRIE